MIALFLFLTSCWDSWRGCFRTQVCFEANSTWCSVMCQVSRPPSAPRLFFSPSCLVHAWVWGDRAVNSPIGLSFAPAKYGEHRWCWGCRGDGRRGELGVPFLLSTSDILTRAHWWYSDRNFHKFEIIQICIKLPSMQSCKIHVWMDITFVCINVVSCRYECICSKINFCICLNFWISRSVHSSFLLEGTGRFRWLSGAGVWTGVMAWGRRLNLVTHKKNEILFGSGGLN